MWSELWQPLLIGFSLMLIIEGIVPFLYPGRWRRLVQQLANISDKALRITGLISMLAGLCILYMIN
ncbi:DUF2065 domain-containing protein [Aliamphritea hakodatensis]|uniref:DUF2065 domain-containing protein n=1 Tax=Aliamphritea hakodatensis TaxID=2895352 RepID=UPI0022FD7293|nr:DUF2065 domain-containing protein [Aliamphritea hakodatensis]